MCSRCVRQLELRDFDPDLHPHAPAHAPGGIGGQFVSTTHSFLRELAGLDEGETPNGLYWSTEQENDTYVDWSSVMEDGDLFGVEVGSPDDEPALIHMSGYSLGKLYESMSIDRIRETKDPDERARLVDAMVAAGRGGHLRLDGPDYSDESEGSYLDWSTVHADGSRTLEVSDDDGNSVSITLTPEQFKQLHARLGLTVVD